MRVRKRLCVELGGFRQEWDHWCTRRGFTPGEGVRSLIVAALDAGAGDSEMQMEAKMRWTAVGDPRARIEVRLTLAEMQVLGQRAAASGLTSNRWIVALIRAQLMREPQLGIAEMQLLSDSNRQLAVISRWLGQLVREGSAAHAERNGGTEIGAIREQIDVHLRTVAAVIRANLDRWSR